MYKFITTLLFMSYLPCLFANTQDQEVITQINRDIELVESFNALAKQRSGGYFTVGDDPVGCDYKKIQNAIDAAKSSGTTDIRIATNQTYNENLVIDDFDVSLTGGYGTCFEATQPFGEPSDDQVLVNGGNTASVLKILGDSQRHTVVLKNLRFVEGLGLIPDTESAGGGILSYQADVSLSLTNVDVRSNDAEYGGGIAIIGGDTDMLMQNSRVVNNLAGYAGGIYCSGGASSIVMTDESGVAANVANGEPSGVASDKQGKGGGVFLNGCYFGLHSGSADGGLIGIASNFAFGDGGGIYADAGSTIVLNGQLTCNGGSCMGDNDNPANISGNIAGFTNTVYSSGGAISARDSSSVTIYAGLIEGNSTSGAGGGIHLYNSSLKVGRLHQACWDKNHCNYFANNTALRTGSEGGAISASTSITDISASVFENNVATYGAAIYTFGLNELLHQLRVESSLFIQNGDASKTQSILHNYGESTATYIHTTIANNKLIANTPDVAVFRQKRNPLNLIYPDFSLHSSIVDNSGFDVLSHNSPSLEVDISCVIGNEVTSMSAANDIVNFSDGTAGGSFISQDIPIFLDPFNSNYELAGNSPAIDYCHTPAHTTVLYKDLIYKNRGYDDPNVDDLSFLSFYDLGAYESYINDIIFIDDFE